MLLGRSLKLAGIVFVGSVLTLVDGLGQQRQLTAEMTSTNDNHQLETVDQPKVLTRSAMEGGARVNAGTTKKSDEVGPLATQAGGEADASPARPEYLPEALFLPNADQLSPLDKAYLDAFSILKQDNTCSRFYGGSRVIEVLNELKKQLKLTNIDINIAVRMSGPTMSVTNVRYGIHYRLFDRAELNLRSSFYRGNTFRHEQSVPAVGMFLPNTREARVTILLHELGHLVEKASKQWLLPNDGYNEFLSHKNTQQIIAVCGEQIRQLSSTSFEVELQAARRSSSGFAVQASLQQ
ncbi:MAG TPA: hypothetical protein VN920_01310 [Pyrinomonadaceae bacterium]|nr:hypothetical protein [Pyrinomonadaceae bacterium]